MNTGPEPKSSIQEPKNPHTKRKSRIIQAKHACKMDLDETLILVNNSQTPNHILSKGSRRITLASTGLSTINSK
jgi:hypothetical protein